MGAIKKKKSEGGPHSSDAGREKHPFPSEKPQAEEGEGGLGVGPPLVSTENHLSGL